MWWFNAKKKKQKEEQLFQLVKAETDKREIRLRSVYYLANPKAYRYSEQISNYPYVEYTEDWEFKTKKITKLLALYNQIYPEKAEALKRIEQQTKMLAKLTRKHLTFKSIGYWGEKIEIDLVFNNTTWVPSFQLTPALFKERITLLKEIIKDQEELEKLNDLEKKIGKEPGDPILTFEESSNPMVIIERLDEILTKAVERYASNLELQEIFEADIKSIEALANSIVK